MTKMKSEWIILLTLSFLTWNTRVSTIHTYNYLCIPNEDVSETGQINLMHCEYHFHSYLVVIGLYIHSTKTLSHMMALRLHFPLAKWLASRRFKRRITLVLHVRKESAVWAAKSAGRRYDSYSNSERVGQQEEESDGKDVSNKAKAKLE